jgi:hypothetical protein
MNDEQGPAATEEIPPRAHSGAGATAGIVLVVIGCLLLLAQFAPGLAWWSAWPLIIVVAGAVQAVTPGKTGWSVSRLFDGLVTVAIGLSLFAWTLGMVGGGFLFRLFSLWPVLVIALGFELLAKALHASWLKVVGSLAIIAALAFAVASSGGMMGVPVIRPAGAVQSFDIREPRGGVRDAHLEFDAGMAQVRIAKGSDLISVEGETPFEKPRVEVDRRGSEADLRLLLGDEGQVAPAIGDARVDARLSDEVVWDLLLRMGLTELDADLSGLKVRSAEIKPGLASCNVKLGEVPEEVGQATLSVKAGISSVSILVPEGVEARVESESGLTGHSIGGDFKSTGAGTWETPGFNAADKGIWTIKIESGIGSIDVDTY